GGLRHSHRQQPLFRGGADDRPARVRGDGRPGEVPDARRGNRMSHDLDLPGWAALLTAILVLGGACVTLIGSLGLLRLGSFYQRVHAPTLGTTMGTGAILVGSMVCFSVLESRPVLHEILIAVFVTVTTPVTLTLLVRATLDRSGEHPPRGDATSGPADWPRD